ncbi:MAG: phenylphosphate carboxylase subunit delta [candidate division Zixibacteria bacterium]|nr:phenylphosphate carboxylase subunit delta [candidate division Zixibacteria bacterium]MBU1472052.1 phenylphosphate carboxylase subunit delta [candidate division Zixibacteria bacterium]MBU2626360.1 phenylphosphate carboxylase subunit delta [candidate division Zixibacteria bacterium]
MPLLTREKLLKKLKPVKLILLDVDGVLTDDAIYVGPDGFELKRFFVSDGLAIRLVTRLGIETGVISARHSAATVARMTELKVPYIYQELNKIGCFEDILKRSGLKPGQTAFMGNDILDIKVMQMAGVAACPADAVKEVIRASDFKAKRNGGYGAVRDFYEMAALSHGKRLVDLI